MLINSLYFINEVSDKKNYPIYVNIALNKDHSIFDGHFPGHPIVPGVCLINMVTDSISHVNTSAYYLKSSSFIKFINTVNPLLIENLTIELIVLSQDENGIELNAVLSSREQVHLKLKGRFETLKNNA